jgi:hypothetical protein
VLFLEGSIRLWSVLHGVVGAALVAAATHLCVWAWPLVRGKAGRWRGTRILATTVLALYAAAFLLGNAIYPVYKVRVRVEYLDNPAALMAEASARATVRNQPAPRDEPVLGGVARLFDVKEHWMALGVPIAAALAALVWVHNPRRRAVPVLSRAIFLLALATAACAWLGALVGLYVSSFRSVGSL